ncbi:Tachykinin-like peptides receptor 99D [Trichoplax sp. H2]|nr:Tachykinin-like peptides receptor 99D [Trichoplax sp. H2]|eukprot:RDD40092.1 Tachykinin-like peptides receptor 99D [Trichoplax sp. H2]
MDAYNNTTINLKLASRIYHDVIIGVLPITTAGLIINIAIVELLLTDRDFFKTTYRLLCISAISDIVSSLKSIIGYYFVVFDSLDYQSGAAWCFIAMSIGPISNGISLMNLALIAVDRYFAIVRPLSLFYRYHKVKFLVISEILIWIVATILSLLFGSYFIGYPDAPLLCDLVNMDSKKAIVVATLGVFLFLIPVTIITTSYISISVSQKKYVRPGFWTSDQLEQDHQKKMRFIKMLISLAICYALIVTPNFISAILIGFRTKSIRQTALDNLVLFLFFYIGNIVTTALNVLNPVLYLIFDRQIRSKLWLQTKSKFSLLS